MSYFLRRPCPARNQAVEALFAENLTAHERVGEASDAVIRKADENRHDLEVLQADIARRTAADRASRPHPHTSDVRALVEDVLNRPGLRGLPPNRKPQ